MNTEGMFMPSLQAMESFEHMFSGRAHDHRVATYPVSGGGRDSHLLCYDRFGDQHDRNLAHAHNMLAAAPKPDPEANSEAQSTGEPEVDFDCEWFKTDNFRMYSFKVADCPLQSTHDWTQCPYLHPGEKARRRDPREYKYCADVCPDFRKGSCKRGDACEYAHGVFESWLHPSRYRTQVCKDGSACERRVCFFAHSLEQLRQLPEEEGSQVEDPPAVLTTCSSKASTNFSYQGPASPCSPENDVSADVVKSAEENGVGGGSAVGGSGLAGAQGVQPLGSPHRPVMMAASEALAAAAASMDLPLSACNCEQLVMGNLRAIHDAAAAAAAAAANGERVPGGQLSMLLNAKPPTSPGAGKAGDELPLGPSLADVFASLSVGGMGGHRGSLGGNKGLVSFASGGRDLQALSAGLFGASQGQDYVWPPAQDFTLPRHDPMPYRARRWSTATTALTPTLTPPLSPRSSMHSNSGYAPPQQGYRSVPGSRPVAASSRTSAQNSPPMSPPMSPTGASFSHMLFAAGYGGGGQSGGGGNNGGMLPPCVAPDGAAFGSVQDMSVLRNSLGANANTLLQAAYDSGSAAMQQQLQPQLYPSSRFSQQGSDNGRGSGPMYLQPSQPLQHMYSLPTPAQMRAAARAASVQQPQQQPQQQQQQYNGGSPQISAALLEQLMRMQQQQLPQHQQQWQLPQPLACPPPQSYRQAAGLAGHSAPTSPHSLDLETAGCADWMTSLSNQAGWGVTSMPPLDLHSSKQAADGSMQW